jgi:septum formation protein
MYSPDSIGRAMKFVELTISNFIDFAARLVGFYVRKTCFPFSNQPLSFLKSPLMPNAAPLILASTSRYRRELLERLGIPFACVAPNIDETQHPDESPLENCRRLALEKAQHVAKSHPNAVVIGSDQVLDLAGEALSKPGDFEHAFAQLKRCQGKTLNCFTALAVVSPALAVVSPALAVVSSTHAPLVDVVPTEIVYRNLPDSELRSYLEKEKPFDAAGAVKVETSGIALLAAVKSDDPTAIIGLPLIRLVDFLRELNFFPSPLRGPAEGAGRNGVAVSNEVRDERSSQRVSRSEGRG